MSKFVDYLLHRPNMLVAALLARTGGGYSRPTVSEIKI